MYFYTAYGLNLQSDIPLPELVEVGSQRGRSALSCAQIRLLLIDRKRPVEGSSDSSHWATPDTACLNFAKAGTYLIRGGREILIDPLPGLDPRIIRLFLLGPAFALLLHQRGSLILHASAISIAGKAAAFVADKGMGKSTMAAAVLARGHALIADDVLAIDSSSNPPRVFGGFPQLKLFPESAELLGASEMDLPRVHPEFDKRAKRAQANFPRDAMPLAAIFELADSSCDVIEPLSPPQSFMTLVRHSYVLPLLSATGASESHFRQTTAVASKVPVLRLLRRRSLADLPAAAALVERHVAGLC